MRHDDPAGRKAREVVGLYGDPDTTWGICLDVGFSAPHSFGTVADRLRALFAAQPGLGPIPELQQLAVADWRGRREVLAAQPYLVDRPLVRVALREDGKRLLVAVHHGVCDGLGMVALADLLTDASLLPLARGIGGRSSRRSFLRSSVARLGEAIWHPPTRLISHSRADSGGEHLREITVPRQSWGTADLVLALSRMTVAWNRSQDSNERTLFVIGASRRPPRTLAPDRQTAYLRLRMEPGWDRDRTRAELSGLPPEPNFPETSVRGIGPRVTRLLRGRLGATAQVSNLGVIEGDGLESVSMFPALSGPRAVAIGLASTSQTTTLSLRTRGRDFSQDDGAELLDRTVRLLVQA